MISVVMISKNEEGAIETVIRDIRDAAPDAEIVVVDSSDDRTPEIAESLGAKVLRQHPPRGYGAAMDLGLRSASGDVIVTLDCDNTYPAEMIPEFARAITDDGYDVVDGSRLKSKPAAMPLINYLANKVFAFMASLLFWRHLTDLHSGMRAYRKSVIRGMRCDIRGEALPVELLLRPLAMGARLKTIFIDYRERLGRSKLNALGTVLWTFRRILVVRFGK